MRERVEAQRALFDEVTKPDRWHALTSTYVQEPDMPAMLKRIMKPKSY